MNEKINLIVRRNHSKICCL